MYNIIAIDGPSGSGKGTIAKEVAKRLNYTYIDTGAIYRSVSLKSLEEVKKQRKLPFGRSAKIKYQDLSTR